MSKNIKLCKDCKFSDGYGEFLKCNAKENLIEDLTTGNLRRRWTFCSSHREMGAICCYLPPFTSCGSHGRWFQTKN